MAVLDNPTETVRDVAVGFERLLDNVETVVRGKREVVARTVTCLLAGGHLLLEDVPGVGKTMLAMALSASVEGTASRLQCTPDLLPSDVTGVQLWKASRETFEFHEGPVFANILLVDEINRAPSKTQSALLEVMQERRVTVDAVRHEVPTPFLVIATQNPVEHAGTYALPEAQLDRFMMKARIGYPSIEDEMAIIRMRTTESTQADDHDLDWLEPAMTTRTLASMIDFTRTSVGLSEDVESYVARLTTATRPRAEHPQASGLKDIRSAIMLGASPRGSVELARAAQARAATRGRPYVTSQDVKDLAVTVLAHRLILEPEAELQGTTPESVVERVCAEVAEPVELVRP